jgi:hypothetical protein
MIPDDSFIFNRNFVARHFDDFEIRLQHTLGQDAAPTLAGGRHLLYACPVCKCPWYKAGRHEYTRLTSEQLAHLSAVFHVDFHIQYALPGKLCPICSTIYLGGIFSVEEYFSAYASQTNGFRMLWESASPPYASLLAIVYPSVCLPISEIVELEPDPLTSTIQDVHAVLQWLETRPCPNLARVFNEAESRLLTYHVPPENANHQEVRQWHGYAWKDICSPRASAVTIALAGATPQGEMVPCARLLTGWRFLARAMRVVL